MSNNELDVSIIIPAYNVEKYIGRCIESAINQTLKSIEIIIVNDGSTDSTLSIIKSYAKSEPRIIIIDKINNGLSSARNAGLSIAQGKYVQHVDGDDWIESDACEELFNFAVFFNCDLVITNFFSDDDNGNIIEIIDSDIQSNKKGKDCLKLFFNDSIYPSIWNKFIKRTLYRDIVHPEKISIGEDLATTAKLLYSADNVGKLNKAFIHYIINPNSMINSSMVNKGFEVILAVDDIKKFLEEKNFFCEIKKYYYTFFYSKVFYFFMAKKSFTCEYLYSSDLIVRSFRQKKSIIINHKNRRIKIIFFLMRLFPFKITLNFILKILAVVRWVKIKLVF